MTLAEILVACFLLLLFMGACVSLITRALRTFRQGDERAALLAQVRTSTYLMTREIREGRELILPFSHDITSSGTTYSSGFISFYYANAVLSYSYDPDRHAIQRALYDPATCNPNDLTAWVVTEKKTVAKNIAYLTFAWEDRVPPQDMLTPSNGGTDPLSPQMVKISIKAVDNPEFPGSGFSVWTKIRMRR
jgi:hypothetical protein